MTTAAWPLRDYLRDLVESAVMARCADAPTVTVDIVSDPPWSPDMMTEAARRQLA